MRKSYIGAILSIGVIAILAITPFAAAAPQPVTATNKIEVTGRVLPTHSVIINPDGDILQIISNTTENVIPRIYVDKISAETEVPLTDDVYVFYQYYVPPGTSKIGTLYQANTALNSSTNVQNRVSLQQLLR